MEREEMGFLFVCAPRVVCRYNDTLNCGAWLRFRYQRQASRGGRCQTGRLRSVVAPLEPRHHPPEEDVDTSSSRDRAAARNQISLPCLCLNKQEAILRRRNFL